MAPPSGTPDTLEKHQHEVCNAFARAAVAMRDAAHTAENFSNWFSRVNNLQDISVPLMFNGSLHANSTAQQQSSEPEQTGKKRKLSGDQEGKKKRQVKEKKPKDVNAPKRPPSAYLLFQNEVRKDVKAAHPDLPYSQLLSEISKLWQTLDDKAKEPYMQATKDSKVLYEKAKADYDATNPTKSTETTGATEATEAPAKPSAAKSKTPATPAATKSSVNKTAVTVAATSNDDDDEEEEESSSSPSSESSSEDDDEEEEAPEPTPEPPRKKLKKDTVVKAPTPVVKVVKKKKPEDGKKKKKAEM